MKSFEFDIEPREVASAEFMSLVHRVLLREMIKVAKVKKLSRADVARILDVDKSVVSRALNGKSNLTIRTISDICWAIGITPDFDACEVVDEHGCNHQVPRDATIADTALIKSSSSSSPHLNWVIEGEKPQGRSMSGGKENVSKFSYAR